MAARAAQPLGGLHRLRRRRLLRHRLGRALARPGPAIGRIPRPGERHRAPFGPERALLGRLARPLRLPLPRRRYGRPYRNAHRPVRPGGPDRRGADTALRIADRPGEPGEPVGEHGRGRAAGRVTVQRRADERQQRRRDPGEVRLAVEDRVHLGLRRALPERGAPGRGERHGGGPGVHVGRLPGRLVREQLWRAVAGGAEEGPGLGDPGRVDHLGDTEVDQHGPPLGEQHVRRLDVPVHDAGRVDDRERGGEPLGEPDELRFRERAAPPHRLEEGLPLDVLHHQVRPVAREVGVEHLGDV